MPVTFYERGDLERAKLAGHVTGFKMVEKICTIFLFQIFPHLCKKTPEDKLVDRTFTKLMGKFFLEIILSSKYSRKCDRFSIVIVNM